MWPLAIIKVEKLLIFFYTILSSSLLLIYLYGLGAGKQRGMCFFFFTFSTSFSGKAPQVKLQHQTTNHFLVWRLLSKLDTNRQRQKNFKKIQ